MRFPTEQDYTDEEILESLPDMIEINDLLTLMNVLTSRTVQRISEFSNPYVHLHITGLEGYENAINAHKELIQTMQDI